MYHPAFQYEEPLDWISYLRWTEDPEYAFGQKRGQ